MPKYLHLETYKSMLKLAMVETVEMAEIFLVYVLGMHLKFEGIAQSMFRKRRDDKKEKR